MHKTGGTMSEYRGRDALRMQLSRLFGADSKTAKMSPQTPAQWRRTLGAVLNELEEYVAANVDTDEVHQWMLFVTFDAARQALKEEDFWPGYVEAITRIALLMMGDYPDHRRRKKGRKDEGHYKLDGHRTVGWSQNPQQRKLTLYAAKQFGFPRLSGDTIDRLHEFRNLYGYRASDLAFVEWYRKTYPEDYAAVFR
jgi:hypothetical protein